MFHNGPARVFENRLLASMPEAGVAALRPSLEEVFLPAQSVLFEANTSARYVYFLCDGIASSQGPLAISIIGREGMSGAAVVAGLALTPFDAVVQVAGSALRIPASALVEAMSDCEPLSHFLHRYVGVRMAERAYSSTSAAEHSPLERTARWLLMCHDRVDGDLMPVSRKFLQLLVGEGVDTVTNILLGLENDRSIRSTLGWVEIRNRERLIRLAGASYGVVEAQYDRFLSEFASSAVFRVEAAFLSFTF